MLSKKSKYAIHALVFLAEKAGQGPVSIQEIADAQKIPKRFLENILIELKKGKILHSKKGKMGGYYLGKSPDDINMMDIIRITNGAIAMLPCVSLNFYESCDECIDEDLCGIRHVFIDIRDATLKILSESTLTKFLEKQKKLKK
ncbi:MAG: Rrf2 family transcriptional regulator [Cyclobacteriaceae bacterium]|nr:Rrf2 family transcriptional regulator [Cyclobacteriaceae bacterium]